MLLGCPARIFDAAKGAGHNRALLDGRHYEAEAVELKR